MIDSFQLNELNNTDSPAALENLTLTSGLSLSSPPPPPPPPLQPVMMLDPFYDELRTSTRFWVQRVVVPCITLVGLFGNAITIIIMTRRRMRSTTNMYLAALAFVDMLYLVLTFLLGIRHYPHVDTPSWYAYWRLRPFLNMLTDACSNTSVWLTVTFTIERFIAVKYPMKGKVWCTEARAKKLIVGVFVFGILFAAPVPFEWKVTEKVIVTRAKQVAPTGTPNKPGLSNTTTGEMLTIGQLGGTTSGGPESMPDLFPLLGNDLLDPENDRYGKAEDDLGRNWDRLVDDDHHDHDGDHDQAVGEDLRKEAEGRNMNKRSSETESNQQSTRTDDLAKEAKEEQVQVVLALEKTEFGLNETYKTIYYWSTAVIFCFVPLILLTLFNGFLIRSVHSSRRKRNLMTNTHATGQQQTQTAVATAAASACQIQRGLSLRDHLRKQDNKLGRARLLIKRRNSNSGAQASKPSGQVEGRQGECKSAATAAAAACGPPKSKVIIRPSRSSSPPNITRPSDREAQASQQRTTVCLRNSIIKLAPGQTGAGRQCAPCAKVTFRHQAARGGNSWQSANDNAELEYPRRPMPIVNERVNESDIERGKSGPSHVDLTCRSTCDTVDDKQLWDINSRTGGEEEEEPPPIAAPPVGAIANSTLAVARQSSASALPPPPPPPLPGQCDLTTGIHRPPPSLATRLDDIGDNGEASVVGSPMENLQQSKLTLGRSKSAHGAGANGRFVGNSADSGGCGDNNHSRLHKHSFIFGNRGSGSSSSCKGGKSGMLNDDATSPMSTHCDNGMTIHASGGAQLAQPPPPPPSHSHAAASSQERRITIMLIAVVILFLVCQIPSAAMLLYTSVHEPQPNTNEDALLLICGNIFNLLMAFNAAGNFILYSFLSKKYRDTFVTTFCKCTWARGRVRGLAKSRGGGTLVRQSTTSQGRASRETSTTQHLFSSYQSTTTGGGGGGGNSSASSDDTTRCSTPASLVRFCKSVRAKATSHRARLSSEPANTQPLQSGQLGNGRHNLL